MSFENIRKDIQNKSFKPIYFLYGDEAYFIDQLTNDLIKNVLTEDEKAFNEHIFYGNDVDMSRIVMQAKQFPMMSDYQLVIVKEAQHLHRELDELKNYAESPLDSTILVFNYKYKNPDKRTTVIKNIKKNGVLAEFKKLYDNQIPNWIEQQANSRNLHLENYVKFILAEYIGSDLSRIVNELDKLKVILSDNSEVTPEIVEKHIGISKEFNNFELTKALSKKDIKTAFKIINYFGKNPKDNSIFATISVLYNFFTKVMIYHTLKDKSQRNVASALGVHPFFTGEYEIASRSFPIKKTTQIISFLRETDMKAKGVGSTGNVTENELMIELMYKIFRV